MDEPDSSAEFRSILPCHDQGVGADIHRGDPKVRALKRQRYRHATTACAHLQDLRALLQSVERLFDEQLRLRPWDENRWGHLEVTSVEGCDAQDVLKGLPAEASASRVGQPGGLTAGQALMAVCEEVRAAQTACLFYQPIRLLDGIVNPRRCQAGRQDPAKGGDFIR